MRHPTTKELLALAAELQATTALLLDVAETTGQGPCIQVDADRCADSLARLHMLASEAFDEPLDWLEDDDIEGADVDQDEIDQLAEARSELTAERRSSLH